MSTQCTLLLIGSGVIGLTTGSFSYNAYLHADDIEAKQYFEKSFLKSIVFIFTTWFFAWLGEFVSWILGGFLIFGEVMHIIYSVMMRARNMMGHRNHRSPHK